MFKLVKILNSNTSTPELYEISLDGEGELDIVANCIYHFANRRLCSPVDVTNPHLFIPIKNYERSAKKATGYFITPDMLFETGYVDMVGDGAEGNDFILKNSDGSSVCDIAEILSHTDTGIGIVVSRNCPDPYCAIVKFKI